MDYKGEKLLDLTGKIHRGWKIIDLITSHKETDYITYSLWRVSCLACKKEYNLEKKHIMCRECICVKNSRLKN